MPASLTYKSSDDYQKLKKLIINIYAQPGKKRKNTH